MKSRISNYKKHLIDELCAEHNKLRKNPKCYIEILQKVSNLIRKNNILHLIGERPYKTIEGKSAVLEAINFLTNFDDSLAKKLSERLLIISDYLNEASTDHAEDIGFQGSVSHVGSDKSHMNDRVEKYCDWDGGLAESLDFGTNNAQNIMVKLLICDGDKNRTQRKYIFDPGFIYFGAGFSQHMKYRNCSVISYGAFVKDKNLELSESELIKISLDIHENFKNKNILEINDYFKINTINKNELNKNKEENLLINKTGDKNEELNENEDKKDNFNFEKIENIEESKNNDSLLAIEEKDNDNEKEEKKSDIKYNDKINKIKEREYERYDIKIKETTYKIKEGNFHIIEEEIFPHNNNWLNKL